ncbi:MAG: hypothetical protein M1832_004750 [Thelocarpon impressellum]|nr:MAG: hypothetical protein M1832_004750 [Thelocarpon impressellum]
MPAAKRRKVDASRTAVTTPGRTSGIAAFGRISKVQAPVGKPTDTPAGGEDAVIITCRGLSLPGDGVGRKRKADGPVPDERAAPPPTDITGVENQKRGPAWHLKEAVSRTPRKSRSTPPASQSIEETPTKGARGCLKALLLDSPSSKKSTEREYEGGSSTTSESRLESLEEAAVLPAPLQDLVNLCSSFLTALSLHFAHNGSLAPADLRLLAPTIARTWGMRSVVAEDISRVIGVLRARTDEMRASVREAVHGLQLKDYGGGRVCVEITRGSAGILGRPVDEDTLNALFVTNLCQLWTDHGDKGAEEFYTSLPMVPIPVSTAVSKLGPLLAKGQRRLEEFRVISATAREEQTAKTKTAPHAKRPRAAADRGKGLLERIRAKQLHTSTLPPPPTQTSLSRVSALERLPEIIPVLTHLAGASTTSATPTQRLSIPMSLLLQHLRTSLVNPIAADEGELAVRILAEDVAPGWVEVVRMGRVVAVVVKRGGKPAEAQLKAALDACR